MEYNLFKYENFLPIKIIVYKNESYKHHFQKDLRLCFILKGNVIFETSEQKLNLKEDDIFILNSFELNSIQSTEDSEILFFSFDVDFYEQYCKGFKNYYFEIKDFSSSEKEKMELLKNYLAGIMVAFIKQTERNTIKIIEISAKIISFLINNFCSEKRNSIKKTSKHSRFIEILSYIEENYSSEINLEILSDKLYMSPQYFSKMFKNTLGVGFVEYLNQFRIKKSLPLLENNDKKILDIAIECGFNDNKTYSRAFKREYNLTPTEYREQFFIKTKHRENASYENKISEMLKPLFIHLNSTEDTINSKKKQELITLNFDIQNIKKKTYDQYWKKLMNVERAALLLRQEIRNQITKTQKELNFEFIRFYGIFSDELNVYNESNSGEPVFYWNYIDEILDFAKSVNLKPYIQIGFMPEKLALNKNNTLFLWKAHMSYPSSMEKWLLLVTSFIKHCIIKYGINEVKEWKFEIWNNPNMEGIFWYDGKNNFFEFYKETFLSIKNISGELQIGSPSIGSRVAVETSWFDDFLHYCRKNSLTPDFFSFSIYSYTKLSGNKMPEIFVKNLSYKSINFTEEDFVFKRTGQLKKILSGYGFPKTAIFVSEWNSTPFIKDYLHDTCFQSVYVLSNILSNINNINGIGYWAISDIFEQNPLEEGIFKGGFGLYTYNGLKKPAYNSYYLLSKLGNELIESGKNYIITSKENNFQILIYNSVYFDLPFMENEKAVITYSERYSYFTNGKEQKINIILNLEESSYIIKKTYLNRDSGSIFDAWVLMGKPENITPDIYNYLQSKEIPEIKLTKEINISKIFIEDSIPVNGILLIEIEKISL